MSNQVLLDDPILQEKISSNKHNNATYANQESISVIISLHSPLFELQIELVLF